MSGRWLQLIGYLIAIAGVVWVFYDVHTERLFNSAALIRWQLVPLAVGLDICTYVTQGMRWSWLLRPVAIVSPLKTTQAVYIGLLGSEILPFRPGELIRGYVVSRWINHPFSSVLPSMVVGRLFDGVWLALSVGVTAMMVELPYDLIISADLLGAAVIITTLALLLLLWRRRRRSRADVNSSVRGAGPKSLLARLEEGIADVGLSRRFIAAFTISSGILIFQMLSLWVLVLACGVPLEFWSGAVVLLVIHLGTLIPNAPANVGSYQLFCVLGLSLFGVEKTTAVAVSLVAFILLTLPLLVIGIAATMRSGFHLGQLRSDIAGIITQNRTAAR